MGVGGAMVAGMAVGAMVGMDAAMLANHNHYNHRGGVTVVDVNHRHGHVGHVDVHKTTHVDVTRHNGHIDVHKHTDVTVSRHGGHGHGHGGGRRR